MKALEIYQQDATEREGGAELSRQQYFLALRDALYQELMGQGYSDLLEALLLAQRGGEMERIYVLDYAALTECYNTIIWGRDMQDAATYVPNIQLRGGKVLWSDMEQQSGMSMRITADMVEKFKILRSVSRQIVDARNGTVLPQADDAARREIGQVHTLNKMLDDRCKALEIEREKLKKELQLLEENVITERVRYAIEARRIQEEEALQRQFDAQREAAKNAFREQYAQDQAEEQARRENEERLMADVRAQAAGDYAGIRQGMAADLRQLTALLEAKVNAWDRALDRKECLMLAQSYVSLHELLTAGVARLILDARCAGADAALMEGLTTLETQLRDRIRQLEQAMVRLGLTVLRPAEGESFNGAFHLPVATSAGAVGDTVIRRCVHPGVMVQGAREALLKAEVETK